MSKLYKIAAHLRAVTDDDVPEGILRGYAATYGESYKTGPRSTEAIQRGAFDDDLASKDHVIPVYASHGWAKESNDVPIGIAHVRSDGDRIEIEEASLYIDTDPKAMSVWRAAKDGGLREWSIGFLPSQVSYGQTRSDEVIEQGELLEVSVVLKGMATGLTGMSEVREADYADDEDETEDPEADAEGAEDNETEDNEGADEGSDGSEGSVVDPEIVERALAHPDLRKLLGTVVVH